MRIEAGRLFVREFCVSERGERPDGGGGSGFGKNAAVFAGRCEDLKKACEKLGGVPEKVGDVAYKLPLFDFMEVIFQFWDADEEFEASVRILWDENILSYMRFETTFYAALHLLERLKELAEV